MIGGGWIAASRSLGGCQYHKPTPHHHTLFFWPGSVRECAQGRVIYGGHLTTTRHVKGTWAPFTRRPQRFGEYSRVIWEFLIHHSWASRDVLGRQCDGGLPSLSHSPRGGRRRCAGIDRRGGWSQALCLTFCVKREGYAYAGVFGSAVYRDGWFYGWNCLGKHDIIRGKGPQTPRGLASSAKTGQPPPKGSRAPVKVPALGISGAPVLQPVVHRPGTTCRLCL